MVTASKDNTIFVNYGVTLEVGDTAPLVSVTTPDPGPRRASSAAIQGQAAGVQI